MMMDAAPLVSARLPVTSSWRVLSLSRDILQRPVCRWLDNTPWVVWRDGAGKASVLSDYCPHRGASLSQGRVVAGAITCPYHGWSFDGSGRCIAMPALPDAPCQMGVPRLDVCEQGGFILVRPTGLEASIMGLPMADMVPGHRRMLARTVDAGLIDVAENALDTTHTSILHAGYLRTASRRNLIQPRVVCGPDWIEAHYPAQAAPSGLLGTLAGGQHYDICDRFRAPGIAEIIYSRAGQTVFALAFHLTEAEAGKTAIFAAFHVPGPSAWATIKTKVIELLLVRVFAEDAAILASTAANHARFGPRPPAIMPQDLLRAGIEAIMNGKEPKVPSHIPKILV